MGDCCIVGQFAFKGLDLMGLNFAVFLGSVVIDWRNKFKVM